MNALDLENDALHDANKPLLTILSGMSCLTQVHHDVCESRGVGCANPTLHQLLHRLQSIIVTLDL